MSGNATVEESSIKIVPYDPNWIDQFNKEANSIKLILGDFVYAIEHFGSTSVPGLSAKPIVDILIGTTGLSKPNPYQVHLLEGLGYVFLGEDGRRPGRWFLRKQGRPNFNISIVPHKGYLWEHNIAVKDYLRSHPKEISAYSAIKYEAASNEPDSLLGYQNYKRSFVEALSLRALAWYKQTLRQ